mgnify:CR=1 FL=1
MPYILSDELLQKGQKDLKNAKNDHVSVVFDFRGNIVDLLPDEFCYGFGTIFSQHDCLSAMAAATRPVLRAKLYQAYTRKKGD